MWTEIVVFDLSFEDYENENDSADCPSGKLLKICEMEPIPLKRRQALNLLNASLEWEVVPYLMPCSEWWALMGNTLMGSE